MKSRKLGVYLRVLAPIIILLLTISAVLYAQTAGPAQPVVNVQSASQTGVVGFTPAEIRHAYGFDQILNQGEGQTIAVVNAFDHPSIEQDFAVFNRTFNLPPCTTANGCFRKINLGSPGVCPSSDPNINVFCAIWGLEIAVTVEWAHAIAPQAKILLVEAPKNNLGSLLMAVDQAVANGANVVSMSWGASEPIENEIGQDAHFTSSNISFFAASGDFGTGVFYPAASPYVMGVGATTLHLDSKGNYSNEKAWGDSSTNTCLRLVGIPTCGSGGGLSTIEPEPTYQIAYPIPNDPDFKRGTPDVAYVGDPNTGIAVYDSVPMGSFVGWFMVGGTSIGPPQWSGLFAIANSVRQQAHKRPLTPGSGLLYDVAKAQSASFNDIGNGKNGSCGTGCNAKPGYDYVTGLGTPNANILIPTLASMP